MNITKKINVNFSSLVGLKAELLRKQAEVNEAKLKTESINAPPRLNKKRNKKIVAEDTEKNTKETIDPEDIVAHKKSKLMLEAKARLYEKLKKLKNNNDKFLVDFKNKMDESDEFVDETINEEYPIEPEENWVEYQDCFGRTRKCLREDLPHMQRKDDIIKQEIMKKNANDTREEENKEQYSTIEEKEPEIEIMRRKWEEQTQKLADKVDIHYQDVLFDEARTHGVGYYAFSQDEEDRIKQQENLANLRKETEKKQKEMKEIKELKERMEQNRLKAARIRQRIRAGLPAEPTEEELAQENDSITKAGNIDTKEADDESVEKNKDKSNERTDEKSVKESNATIEKVVSDEDKIKAFGELLGKRNHWHVMSQEEWVHECRTQRNKEFAPVYDNLKSVGFYDSNQDIDEQSSYEDNKELSNTKSISPKAVCNTKDISTNLEKYEAGIDSIVTNEPILNAKETSNNQNDKDSLAQCNIRINKDNTGHELSRNVMESMSNPTSLLNLSQPQRQTTVSYPLSHLSSKYSQVIYDYSEAHGTGQMSSELPNAEDIPLPGENTITYIEFNDITNVSKQKTLPHSINEHNIMVGLKYLREKFEESHNK